MIEKLDKNVNEFINKEYSYGFFTKIDKEIIEKGLNEEIIRLISKKNNEPLFLLNFRLKAFNKWKVLHYPKWSKLRYKNVDYQKIRYYSSPKLKNKLNDLKEAPKELIETLEKLGISILEQKKLANVAIDVVFDSVSIGTTFKSELSKQGIIFCSILEASKKYPILLEKYLGTVVSMGDNYFTALNSAIFTDGSFCYIPKNVKCPLDLSTYFRINDRVSGQFERTLIIAEENSQVNYLEGCTAPQYSNNQLHAAVVELIALSNSEIRYSTVQNWYSGNSEGKGGIYNFVTKRGLCAGKNSKIFWTQIETGSSITWKYPSCILLGNKSKGEFYSVALTGKFQQADTGSKIVHIGKKTKSRIISKGIASDCSINTYRGLVKFIKSSFNSRNFSQCDSLLFGNKSSSNTFPLIYSNNCTSILEHEASVSKIGEDQLFYFSQRGIKADKAIELIISGFCKEVFAELPLEFAYESNKLLNLKLEGSIG
jgi:Fe-S cluster assembly protein SufB